MSHATAKDAAADLVQTTQTDDGFVVITINRPEARNALNLALVTALSEKLRELHKSPPVALLIRGAGDEAFVAGADVGEMQKRKAAEALARINATLFQLVEHFPAPTIAVISGFALGGGCELALACDLRVASEDAVLGQPEVGLGIIPGAGATFRLAQQVGLGRAKELIFTARRVNAQEAYHMGLVNRVVPRATLMDEALKLAREMAKNGQLAVRLAKASINAAYAMPAALMQLEAAHQAVLFETEEKHERMGKFLAKTSKAAK